MALHANGLIVDHDLVCTAGFTATGEVRLLGAHIGGEFNFNGATLTNPNGAALNADRATVGQDMLCQDGFTLPARFALSVPASAANSASSGRP